MFTFVSREDVDREDMDKELQKAIDIVCLNCTQDTLNNSDVCNNCPVRKTTDDLLLE